MEKCVECDLIVRCDDLSGELSEYNAGVGVIDHMVALRLMYRNLTD